MKYGVTTTMVIFLTLFLKIIPLYCIILLGYIAGRRLHVKKESIAPLLIYIIAPVVIFTGVAKADISAGTVSLPLFFFTVASILCLLAYSVASFMWSGSEKNILAFSAGAGNVGYFGLPVAVALFGESIIPLVVLSIFGIILYENTLGFYITAKGNFSSRESTGKVLRLPAVYAFFLGLAVNMSGTHPGQAFTDIALYFQGAYTVLGMMLVGLGIASAGKLTIDVSFTVFSFIVKFLLWPLMVVVFIGIDAYVFHIYTDPMYKVMILLSAVPLGANVVAYATELETHPEKAATAVLLSTLVALIYIPALVVILHL